MDIASITDKLKQLNVVLVAVGNGTVNMAKSFKEEYVFDGELYVDTKLASYKAFDLPRSFFRTFVPVKGALSLASALAKGVRVGPILGDQQQQGGLFIVGPGDQIVYGYINQATGDHAPLEDILHYASK